MLFDWAGWLGVDPDRFTARELAAAVAGRGRMIEAEQRAAMTGTACVLAMLANCHRLGMDRFDRQGHRHDGPHPQQWIPDEFLPREYRTKGKRNREREIIHGSIECLKVFLPPGAKPTTLSRDSFTVIDEDDLVAQTRTPTSAP